MLPKSEENSRRTPLAPKKQQRENNDISHISHLKKLKQFLCKEQIYHIPQFINVKKFLSVNKKPQISIDQYYLRQKVISSQNNIMKNTLRNKKGHFKHLSFHQQQNNLLKNGSETGYAKYRNMELNQKKDKILLSEILNSTTNKVKKKHSYHKNYNKHFQCKLSQYKIL